MVLNWGTFSSRGHHAMSGNLSGCHSGGQEGTTGIERVEAREASEYSPMHRAAPITKNYLVRNVHNEHRLQ